MQSMWRCLCFAGETALKQKYLTTLLFLITRKKASIFFFPRGAFSCHLYLYLCSLLYFRSLSYTYSSI